MEKVTTEALMKLEIGEEIELIKNQRRFIRVSGGWIFETYYAAHEKVVPLFIPEPQQELVECVQSGIEIKIPSYPAYKEDFEEKDEDFTYQSPEHKTYHFLIGAILSLFESEKSEIYVDKDLISGFFSKAKELYNLPENKSLLQLINHGK